MFDILENVLITAFGGFICCLILYILGKILEVIYSHKIHLDEIHSDKDRLKRDLWSSSCVILVGISWITNCGIIRLFTFYIPMLQAVIFFLTNDFYGQYIESGSKMRWLNYSIYIIYILSNLLLPDGEHISGSYVLFGLYGIKDSNTFDAFYLIASLLQIISVVLFIIQMILIIIIRNRKIRSEVKRAKQHGGNGA